MSNGRPQRQSRSSDSTNRQFIEIKVLLVTDLENSTKITKLLGDLRASEIFREADSIALHLLREFSGNYIDKSDGYLFLFTRAIDALGFALAYHAELAALSDRVKVQLKTRVGIHVGEVLIIPNSAEAVQQGTKRSDVMGFSLPTTARIMALAVGGQTLLSKIAYDMAMRGAVGEEDLLKGTEWRFHGPYCFKGNEEEAAAGASATPLDIYEIGVPGIAPLEQPADSEKAWRYIDPSSTELPGWRPSKGSEIPSRPGWKLEEKLGEGGAGEVWVAVQSVSAIKHVYKFCYKREAYARLQREMLLYRTIMESLGDREDIARVISLNMDDPPVFIELEYTHGGNLYQWANSDPGLKNIPLSVKLELVARIADALSAAHSVSVLHKDLKPTNILIRKDGSQIPAIRLTDFGLRLPKEGESSDAIENSQPIPSMDHAGSFFSSTNSRLYMAPELVEGRQATVQSDIYSLGVILYQLVVGDLNRAIAPGWERCIKDVILREDIAECIDGNRARRLSSASALADRLRNIEDRRDSREKLEREERIAAENAERILRYQRHRKQAIVLIILLSAGILGTGTFASIAYVASIEAKEQQRYAEENSKIARAEQANALAAAQDAKSARDAALKERERAETERKNAIEAKEYADAAKATAENEKLKAEANEKAARDAEAIAEVAKQAAIAAKTEAEDNLRKLKAASERLEKARGATADLVILSFDELRKRVSQFRRPDLADVLTIKTIALRAYQEYGNAMGETTSDITEPELERLFEGLLVSTSLQQEMLQTESEAYDILLALLNARDRAETMHKAAPESRDWKGRLAEALIACAMAYSSLEDFSSATENLSRAVNLLGEMRQSDRSNPTARYQHARALIDLAQLDIQKYEWSSASEHLGIAEVILDLSGMDSAKVRDLRQLQIRIFDLRGQLELLKGYPLEAISRHTKVLELLAIQKQATPKDELQEKKETERYLLEQAAAHTNIGDANVELEKNDEAMTSYSQAAQLLDRLLISNPGNLDLIWAKAQVLEKSGWLLQSRLAKTTEARELLKEAVRYRHSLIVVYPSDRDTQVEMALSLLLLAASEEADGEIVAALESRQQALEYIQKAGNIRPLNYALTEDDAYGRFRERFSTGLTLSNPPQSESTVASTEPTEIDGGIFQPIRWVGKQVIAGADEALQPLRWSAQKVGLVSEKTPIEKSVAINRDSRLNLSVLLDNAEVFIRSGNESLETRQYRTANVCVRIAIGLLEPITLTPADEFQQPVAEKLSNAYDLMAAIRRQEGNAFEQELYTRKAEAVRSTMNQ